MIKIMIFTLFININNIQMFDCYGEMGNYTYNSYNEIKIID